MTSDERSMNVFTSNDVVSCNLMDEEEKSNQVM